MADAESNTRRARWTPRGPPLPRLKYIAETTQIIYVQRLASGVHLAVADEQHRDSVHGDSECKSEDAVRAHAEPIARSERRREQIWQSKTR